MTESQSPEQKRKNKPKWLRWPMVRKLESMAFMAMFLAVPFFAFRVVDYTTKQLTFNNAAHDLVKDLRRAKDMAREFQIDIQVSSFAATPEKPAGYLIKTGTKTMEEVVIPAGVSIQGGVAFDAEGVPEKPGSFDLKLGNREVSVDVDLAGVVKVE